MTIELSVSAKPLKNIKHTHNGCAYIIDAFQKANIEGKFVPNISIIDKQLELGCTVTLPKQYTSKASISSIWEITKYSIPNNSIFSQTEYDCAHIKINNEFQGCIYNYLKPDFCPSNIMLQFPRK